MRPSVRYLRNLVSTVWFRIQEQKRVLGFLILAAAVWTSAVVLPAAMQPVRLTSFAIPFGSPVKFNSYTAAGQVASSDPSLVGCTPGFWKTHATVPPWVDFTPTQTVASVFTIPSSLSSFASETLLDALQGSGGSGVTGAVPILLRAAVAAILDTRVHSYLFTTAQVISQTNTALASLDRTQILALATKLDQVNQECEVPFVYVSIIFGHQVLSVDRFTGATTVFYPNATSQQLSPPIDPEGMAIGPVDGKLYVFDRDNDRIIRLDRTGNNLEIVYDRANATAPNDPRNPEAPSFTPSGDLYFNTAGFPDGSGGAQGIWTIGADQLGSLPPTGAVPTNVVTAAQLGSPLLCEGTAFDSRGNLYVVDAFSPEQVMRWDGSSVVTFIANGLNCNPCFEEPVSVAVNSQGSRLQFG